MKGASSDQDKALALWKWFRLLVAATGGGYMYEGETPGEEELVYDPHIILTVYGHHQCDGLSWSMVPLWRAAGYLAYDQCHFGHTSASLGYRDEDGEFRFHDLDPQRRYIHWDSRHQRIGTWSMPLMRGLVQRHLTAPQRVHTLRTSLRIGETIKRRWDGQGFVIVPGRRPLKMHPERQTTGTTTASRRAGAMAFTRSRARRAKRCKRTRRPLHFAQALFPGSKNVACSADADGAALLHPSKPGETAELIYRIASPYVGVEGNCEAIVVKGDANDVCRISLSRDGVHWQAIFDKKEAGEEKVNIDLGRGAREQGRPHIYTAYTFFIKVELSTPAMLKAWASAG